jgi:hypothetical protein
MKFDWKQLAIAITLFLAGYFTFNGGFFSKPASTSLENNSPVPAAQKPAPRSEQATETSGAY